MELVPSSDVFLTLLRPGCAGIEVRRAGLPFTNALLWYCQCNCEWIDHAEVLLVLTYSFLLR